MTATLSAPRVGVNRLVERVDLGMRRWRWAGYAALAALAYVPVLLSATGRVAADSKQYLYLDPSRLLQRAPWMWNPNIGLGTVTHQSIGYLFPVGPYYWFFDAIGVPAWVAQRIWLGSIIFLAGVGVLFLLRTLAVRGPGAVAAAVVYMLTPYLLNSSARVSVILLPFAGLPWMIGLVVRALRSGRWREPAAFALVVQLVGSVNATALVFAGIGAALWIPYAVWGAREVDGRRALAATARIGVLTIAASLWWIAGLSIQSGYGLNVLRYTETLDVVTRSSSVPEVLRGLGYWYFYGGDRIGAWIEASSDYMSHVWLIVVGFAITTLAFVSAAFTRWKHKIFFVALVLVGTVIAVGAYPYSEPSLYGRAFRSFARDSTAGLALRSTARAVPLIVLGLAVLLGAGLTALATRLRERRYGSWAWAGAALVCVLAVVNLPALWNGSFYGDNLLRPADIPDYWTQAIAALDRRPHDTRILEVPGVDFTTYRWGETVDPITPGLTDRPYVARELVPYGTPPSADLLNAFDNQLQSGTLDRASIAPIARLMSVGDVVLRSDLEVDRYDIARPRPTWQLLTAPRPDGLDPPANYGTRLGPPLHVPQLDELELALPANAPTPAPVSIFPVHDATPIVRAASTDQPLLVSGSGDGLVDAAAIGLLDGKPAILYSAANDAKQLGRQLTNDAVLVVTDTNRKRGERWAAIHDVYGHTERADEHPLTRDEYDNRLPLFPGAGTDAYTVVEQQGAKVDESREGSTNTYQPENRGARAFDGDPETAWIVGEYEKVIGEHLLLTLPAPIVADHVNLVQPLVGRRDRFITKVTLTFDGRRSATVPLDDSSRGPLGQTIQFPQERFRTLDVRVADTNVGNRTDLANSGVGFAEIRVRDVRPGASDVKVHELVRLPTDLMQAVRGDAGNHRLVYVMTRSRGRLVPPRYFDDELSLDRVIDVPGRRTFALRGTARISTAVSDEQVDQLLGFSSAREGGVTATSSGRLPGDVRARASSALDGDPTTAWSSPFGTAVTPGPVGDWLQLELPSPVTFDHLALQVVADGRHSVPTQLRIEAGGVQRDVTLPPVDDRPSENAVVDAPVSFPPLTGSTIRITVTTIRPEETIDYSSNQRVLLPVAIAEAGLPGVPPIARPDRLPATCRSDLVRVDGHPIPVEVTGDRTTAEAHGALDLAPCDSTGRSLAFDPGRHVIESTPGKTSGIDVDGLVVASEAGGAPLALGPRGQVPATTSPRPATPAVRVETNGRTQLSLRVSAADAGNRPFWLVLGQSQSSGWTASVDGKELGRSRLLDGYANGWVVRPEGAGALHITLSWTPQRRVWVALALSGVALLVCVLLAFGLLRRRRGAVPSAPARATDASPPALDNPLASTGTAETRRLPWSVVVIASVGVALVAAAVSRVWLGIVLGLVVFEVLLRPRLRFVLSLGAVVAVGFMGLYVAIQQLRHDYFPVLEWPQHFNTVNLVGWAAVLLLGADALVGWLRARGANDSSAS